METITRKEFLSLLGLSSAALAVTYCFGGCQPSKNGVPTAPTNVDFTLDLTNPVYGVLKSNGGYVYNDGVIVARTITGSYVAVSKYCTHAGGTVEYNKSGNDFYCPVHGSVYSLSGNVLQGPAQSPLVKYNTSLNGTSLRVYS
jgi:cytochrome b6-f complex iron-sulfur subunit